MDGIAGLLLGRSGTVEGGGRGSKLISEAAVKDAVPGDPVPVQWEGNRQTDRALSQLV